MSSRSVWKPHPQAFLSAALLLLFVYMIIEGWGWPDKTKLFPMFVAFPMSALAALQLIRDLTRRVALEAVAAQPPSTAELAGDGAAAEVDKKASRDEGGLANAGFSKIAVIVAQMLAYFVGIWVLGFVEVIPVFTTFYLRFAAKEPWWRAILQAALIWAFTWGLFVQTLHLPFTSGVVVDLIKSLIAVQ